METDVYFYFKLYFILSSFIFFELQFIFSVEEVPWKPYVVESILKNDTPSWLFTQQFSRIFHNSYPNSFGRLLQQFLNPADNYMLKVNNRNIRTMCVICLKLAIKTPEQLHWRRFCSSVSFC